ncbi:TonB-dependent receptor [Altericroceibacterium xinjiangense]|uniref:TonB-dependent receptor n=1 Tax=Altericroceibacterium xinjiangense TaxID=762261 RepID=UPI0013E0D8B6|nr:TonB-dependent receptor [Altericroceibacterium xinjiangense]
MVRNTASVLSIAIASWAGAAQAQVQAPAQNQVPGGDPVANVQVQPSNQLEAIIVTANRQAQSLTDVPISITAFTQETLDQKGVRQVDDLTRLTPGVVLDRSDTRNAASARISIRGIDSSAGAATTGIYIDDTPIQVRQVGFASYSVFPAIFDLERVEVLRGPQGTLFGAGSEGGTVRFITPRPDIDNVRAYSRAEIATTKNGDESFEAGAAINLPLIANTLAARISGYYRKDGGYIDRVEFSRPTITRGVITDPAEVEYVEEEDVNSINTLVLQGSLRWEPSAYVTVLPSVFFQKVETGDANIFWENFSDRENGDFRQGNALGQPSNDKFVLPSLNIEVDLGGVQLVSNTSYFYRDQSAINDYTTFEAGIYTGSPYYPQGNYARAFQYNSQENWTQEVRLQSANPDARLSWVIGAFYTHNKQRAQQFVEDRFLDDNIPGFLPFPVFQAIFGGVPLDQGLYTFVLDPAESIDEQFAGFGQVDFALTESLTLTAGVRVAKTDFSTEASFRGPVVGPVPAVDSGSQSETPITPKFGLSYEPSDDHLFYATVAKGYRVGGYNPKVGNLCGPFLGEIGLEDRPENFGSDSVWSYEIGSKNSLLEDRVQIEASGFYIDWSNIQQQVTLRCGFQFVDNLGSATSKGFDVQFQAAVGSSLTLGGSVGYTKAEFNETVYAGSTSAGVVPLVFEGDDIPLNPWKIYLNAQYDYDVTSTIPGYARVDFQYQSRQNALTPATNPDRGPNATNFGTNIDRQDATLVSVRTGARLGDLDLSVFVNNLLDSAPLLSRGPTVGPIGTAIFQVSTYRPRTYGLTAAFRY